MLESYQNLIDSARVLWYYTLVKQSKENKRLNYQRKKRRGVCPSCGQKSPLGKVLCLLCTDKAAVRQTRYASERPWVKASRNRLRLYGVTPDKFDDMLFSQNGKCGVCGDFFRKVPHVDHDHRTKTVRGLLCHRCNLGLVYVEDDSFATKARIYLEAVSCQTLESQSF